MCVVCVLTVVVGFVVLLVCLCLGFFSCGLCIVVCLWGCFSGCYVVWFVFGFGFLGFDFLVLNCFGFTAMLFSLFCLGVYCLVPLVWFRV